MQSDIEVKFISIDVEEMRHRLSTLMADLTNPMRLIRRAIMDYPDRRLEFKNNGWLRVRDEGDKITTAYKEESDDRPNGYIKVELTVDNFDNAVSLFEQLGLKVRSFQETRREIWQLGNVSITIDEWPWLKSFVAIKGPSESAVRDVSARLGLAWAQAVVGGVTLVYAAQYPGIRLQHKESIVQIPEIKFGAPLPNWLKERQST